MDIKKKNARIYINIYKRFFFTNSATDKLLLSFFFYNENNKIDFIFDFSSQIFFFFFLLFGKSTIRKKIEKFKSSFIGLFKKNKKINRPRNLRGLTRKYF